VLGGLLGVLAVAASVRAYAWSQTEVMFNDGPIFLGMAQVVSEGRWAEVLAHPFHPLYPVLIALVEAATGLSWDNSAVAVTLVGGLLSVLGVWLFVREAFDPGLALLAAWVVALHPWAVDFSSDVMSDGLYAGFYLLGFAAMASLIARPRLGAAIATGSMAGLAYLVRPEGIGLIVVAGLLLSVRAAHDRRERRAILASGLVLLAASTALIGPLVVGVATQTGEVGLTQKKSIVNLASGREGGAARRGVGLNSIREETIPLPRSSESVDGPGASRPSRNLFGLGESIGRAVSTSLAALRYEVAVFAVLGLWGLRGTWVGRREATVLLPAALYSGVLVLLVWGAGYVARRHALAALLPFVAYATLGWRGLQISLIDRLKGLMSPSAGRWLKTSSGVCVVLVLALLCVWGPRDLRARRGDRAAIRAAAEWLATSAGEAEVIAAQKLRVAYYARGHYVPLPSGRGIPMQTTLKRSGAGWVVIEELNLEDHHGLAEGLGDWLQVVHVAGVDGRRALVLELR